MWYFTVRFTILFILIFSFNFNCAVLVVSVSDCSSYFYRWCLKERNNNVILSSLELIFRWFWSRQQLVLSLNDYWHSRRSPHIPCHGEVTQRFSVLSPPNAPWESDQKQFYDQEPLTLTSCQESERRGSKWSAAHIPTHVHRETRINHTQTLARMFWDLVLDVFTPSHLVLLSIMVFVF